jgi:septal ring factor EnvC (AmiA/AmiB activator)
LGLDNIDENEKLQKEETQKKGQSRSFKRYLNAINPFGKNKETSTTSTQTSQGSSLSYLSVD